MSTSDLFKGQCFKTDAFMSFSPARVHVPSESQYKSVLGVYTSLRPVSHSVM